MRGQVIRTQSGFYTVKTEAGEEYVSQVRGRLKQGPREGDVVALGDWVEISRIDKDTGMIEAIEPRERLIARMAPTPQGEYQQIIIANPDQACLVFACEQPAPRLGMLDRYLVIAEQGHVPAVVVANKVDLVTRQEAEALFGLYAEVGYPVIYTSARTGEGLDTLKSILQGKISVLTGPSGAGKSSLLNAIQPGLGLEVSQVSEATTKGRHTTVVRQLFPLKDGGYVADTPGLKALALWDIEPEELDAYFPEMRPRVKDCAFSDCTHVHEPGCAILAAVKAGEIHPERYESYLRIRFGDED